ncbi:DgyrCDS12204 [Dimorphilus gyrociliatus]|uniref:DgyrCDS12204 n=1 Tax=Dimorphilus gyrociliatus TaxID=2664684 RepID=A0A7I8W5V5_9ANNE|nr:DgyrCDS12204 [Dimorphilus gyrociliatus]
MANYSCDNLVDVPDTCIKKRHIDFNRRRSYNVDELLSSSPLRCDSNSDDSIDNSPVKGANTFIVGNDESFRAYIERTKVETRRQDSFKLRDIKRYVPNRFVSKETATCRAESDRPLEIQNKLEIIKESLNSPAESREKIEVKRETPKRGVQRSVSLKSREKPKMTGKSSIDNNKNRRRSNALPKMSDINKEKIDGRGEAKENTKEKSKKVKEVPKVNDRMKDSSFSDLSSISSVSDLSLSNVLNVSRPITGRIERRAANDVDDKKSDKKDSSKKKIFPQIKAALFRPGQKFAKISEKKSGPVKATPAKKEIDKDISETSQDSGISFSNQAAPILASTPVKKSQSIASPFIQTPKKSFIPTPKKSGSSIRRSNSSASSAENLMGFQTPVKTDILVDFTP